MAISWLFFFCFFFFLPLSIFYEPGMMVILGSQLLLDFDEPWSRYLMDVLVKDLKSTFCCPTPADGDKLLNISALKKFGIRLLGANLFLPIFFSCH